MEIWARRWENEGSGVTVINYPAAKQLQDIDNLTIKLELRSRLY